MAPKLNRPGSLRRSKMERALVDRGADRWIVVGLSHHLCPEKN